MIVKILALIINIVSERFLPICKLNWKNLQNVKRRRNCGYGS